MTTEVVAGDGTKQTIPAQGAAAAEQVEVKIDGKPVKVDKAVAAALEASTKAATDAKAAAATAEAARKAAEAKLQAPKEPAKGDDDLSVVIFSDPAEAIRRIKAEVTAEVRAEVSMTNAQAKFWTDFYDENPGLKDADIVVRAVLGREMTAMEPLEVGKAREHLAEATQKELLRLGIKREKGRKQQVAEGGNEPSPKETKKDVGERPLTGGLTGVLKARAEARRVADAGTAN